MSLPVPSTLALAEAAERVANACRVSIQEARDALARAFRDYDLVLIDGKSNKVMPDNWAAAEMDWEASLITQRTRFNVFTWHDVRIFTRQLDSWVGLFPKSSLPDHEGRRDAAASGEKQSAADAFDGAGSHEPTFPDAPAAIETGASKVRDGRRANARKRRTGGAQSLVSHTPGRKPLKLQRVIEAMWEDINAGRCTAETLASEKQEALAARYGVNRETARKARDEVLRQA